MARTASFRAGESRVLPTGVNSQKFEGPENTGYLVVDDNGQPVVTAQTGENPVPNDFAAPVQDAGAVDDDLVALAGDAPKKSSAKDASGSKVKTRGEGDPGVVESEYPSPGPTETLTEQGEVTLTVDDSVIDYQHAGENEPLKTALENTPEQTEDAPVYEVDGSAVNLDAAKQTIYPDGEEPDLSKSGGTENPQAETETEPSEEDKSGENVVVENVEPAQEDANADTNAEPAVEEAPVVVEELGVAKADYPEGAPTTAWKVGELDAYAAAKGIEVEGTAKQKLTQIREAEKEQG